MIDLEIDTVVIGQFACKFMEINQRKYKGLTQPQVSISHASKKFFLWEYDLVCRTNPNFPVIQQEFLVFETSIVLTCPARKSKRVLGIEICFHEGWRPPSLGSNPKTAI